MNVKVERLVRNEGTILVFEGEGDDGRVIHFAAEHRPGREIVAALSAGEEVRAEVDPYQVLVEYRQPEVQR